MTEKKNISCAHGGCLSEFLPGRWRGLRATLVFALCGSLVISGCTSTSPLTGPAGIRGRLSSDKDIRVTLNTGRKFDLKAYRYAGVREPADIVCGTGRRIDRATGEGEAFRGTIRPLPAGHRDTTITEAVYNGALEKRADRYTDFALSDSEFVRFRNGDFVAVRKTDGPGFYYTETGVTAGLTVTRTRMIPLDNIVSIEEKSISPVKTVLAVAGVAAFTALLVGTLGLISFGNALGRLGGPDR